ncbi:hypothetical protein CHU98_g9121 [Xylaria longipes]|nr:hypothetical protein CHU98_g9121 [Xylaria longipes]
MRSVDSPAIESTLLAATPVKSLAMAKSNVLPALIPARFAAVTPGVTNSATSLVLLVLSGIARLHVLTRNARCLVRHHATGSLALEDVKNF